jgi:hypothetical protein
MNTSNHSVTQSRLKELLDYNPSTGVFTWRNNRRPGIKKGDVAGSVNDSGYLLIGVEGFQYRAHRLAWLYMTGFWPVELIDHINHNRKDNRFKNLREATRIENNHNTVKRRKDSKHCEFKGVEWSNRDKKWFSRIMVNKKRIMLGYFKTAEAAHQAYVQAKRKHHIGCTI